MGAIKRFAGVDIGSSYTKAVLLDDNKEVLSTCVLRTGVDFAAVSAQILAAVAKASPGPKAPVFSTGVGRSRCEGAESKKTEITCIARGSAHFCPRPHVVIDIGGQDNKVISVDGRGRQLNFKMNRKCAAGTGAFLEEVSRRLDIPADKMSSMARSTTETVEIGSYCTVFTCTEIIHHIREGKTAPGILRGCYESVVKRLTEMDALAGEFVLAGGVIATHPVVADIFTEMLGKKPIVPPHPQFIGALGAALLNQESHE